MKKIFIFCLATVLSFGVFANNITVANTSVSGQNTVSHFSMIGFDVTWENSWRTSTNEQNWDAAWVFVKFRKKGTTSWLHATFNYAAPGDAVSCGHTPGAGAFIKTPADGKGVFIYRSNDGFGTANYTGNKLRWNYSADGVLDTDSVEVNVYACEMVYVKQGAFYLGSNGSENGHFRKGNVDSAYLVNSENAITIGTATGNLYYQSYSYSGDQQGPIPAAFPKGYNSFYIMKYECSQQQYADFLNNIDAARATIRNGGPFTGTHPNLIAPFPERAYSNASFDDNAAFSDWSALRPMSEMEFEKACRGYNIQPLPNEFAWGNTTQIDALASNITNDGTNNEAFSTGNVNFGFGMGRPVRCGAFATSSTTRTSSGGSYYGAMELSGNVWEFTVTAGTPIGRQFTGVHGDGYIAADGRANINIVGTTDANIYGLRGGGFNNSTTSFLSISDRYYAYYGAATGMNYRTTNYGIRNVRTEQ